MSVAVRCVLFAGYCLLSAVIACCLLVAMGWLLRGLRCLLFAGWWLLFVACGMSCVVCCVFSVCEWLCFVR